jgi:hypothetical protein
MKRHHFVAGLLALLPPLSGNAADALFSYDRQLAVDLSVVYLKAYFRTWPKAVVPGVDFRHPEVIALRDAKRRKLIFVTFASTQSAAGATATFQVCDEPPQLRVTDVDTVDPIGSYRDSLKKGQGQVFVHLDDVCPPSHE